MAYAKRYAGGFVDLPTQTTAIDSTFLNAVEASLLRLDSVAPTADSQVLVWSSAQGKYVPGLLTNAAIDPAASIARSKLGALNIADADVATGAAIALSKLGSSGIIGASGVAIGANTITLGGAANLYQYASAANHLATDYQFFTMRGTTAQIRLGSNSGAPTIWLGNQSGDIGDASVYRSASGQVGVHSSLWAESGLLAGGGGGVRGSLQLARADGTFVASVKINTDDGGLLYTMGGGGSYHRWVTNSLTNAMTLGDTGLMTLPNNGIMMGTVGGISITQAYVLMQSTATPVGTPTGGGALWVEGGALKYKGTSGTVTTIAPA
jgi:hypothetical protein